MARLTTSRYVPPGVYISQLIRPRPGNLSAEARVCNYIGRGSRLAVAQNLGIRRSFVFDEALVFPDSPPFTSSLQFPSDGEKGAPTQIFDAITGVALREDQWNFTESGGEFTGVQISATAFDSNADYRIDYQSTSRQVLDPIPVEDIRVIRAVGNSQNRSQYTDFEDFFVPYTFGGPAADSGNSQTDSFLTTIFPDAGNVGGGAAAIDAAASYEHNYNRFYELECVAAAGTSGNFTATFEWSARRYSGGVDAAPPVPLHTTASKPTVSIDEAVPASLVQDLEFGVKIAFSFPVSNFSIGDKFYFNGVGPGLIEFDGRLTNTNQFLEFSSISHSLVGGSTGTLSIAEDATYSGTWNAKFDLEVINVTGTPGTRTVDLVWAQYGEIIGPTGQVTLDETASVEATLTDGVKIVGDFGINHFSAGDKFSFEVKAPRIFYQSKDDRVIELTVQSATNPGADVGIVTGAYETGTSEGGFGTWEAEVNLLSGANEETGFFTLPDGLSMAVRNAMQGNINGTSYTQGDIFTASVTSDDVLDWSLTTEVTETRETTAFLTDVTGSVTGTAGTSYVILDNVYEVGTVNIVGADSGDPISFMEIPGTRFLAFLTTPTEAVEVTYRYRGEEPAPGQLYFLTASYLRPEDLYNNPQLVLDRQDGRTLLAPSQTDNHLFIMNELAFDNGAPAAYYTQPLDTDGDGQLTSTDVQAALEAHEGISRATDLCLLSLFGSLSDALAVNEQANDPFEKREQMLWVGAPIGTPIGDVDTEDSLVFLARRTLQVTPQSPAQGTRVLVAPTECRVRVLLDSGVEQTVTLDGSFVAGASSALVNSFADPATSILRKNVSGFESIQTYSEPENELLGGASITFLSNQGSGVFRFEEDITVHTLAEEFQLISATTQKQFVTKVVRREMDNTLISVVTPNAQAAVALIRSTLVGILTGLLGRGLIADYQDDEGNIREIDPEADVVIIRDTQTLTRYDFFYAYFIRSPIKRLFGLFAVNTNDFGLGQ